MASGIATRCCGTPEATASQPVLRSDFQNHSSCSAKAKLSSPTQCIAPRPLVGSQLWNARYSENISGNSPKTTNSSRKGASSAYGA